jgi:hypothetical protein
MPNLNRWEGQLGLPVSTSEEAAASHLKPMQIAGGMATVVDLANAEQRMLAAIVEHGQVWFFKLVGPKDVVTAQKEKFGAFVKSVRFESGNVSQASAGAPNPAPAGSGLGSYTTPDGWTLEPARPMRALSFKIDAAGQSGEMIVTRLSANGFGDMLDNINRWRSQVGLEPVASAPPPEDMTIGGRRVAVYDFAGPGASASNAAVAGAKRIRVGTIMNGPDAWFFKLQGSTELVEQQKPAFEKFISSVKFGGSGE